MCETLPVDFSPDKPGRVPQEVWAAPVPGAPAQLRLRPRRRWRESGALSYLQAGAGHAVERAAGDEDELTTTQDAVDLQ